jgi:alpha-tubulin suppressor-like RCC1 family protein
MELKGHPHLPGLNRRQVMRKPFSWLIGISLIAALSEPARAQLLRVWGDDSAGQVSTAPQGEFAAVARGGAFQGLAIRADGTLVLWGGAGDPFAVPDVPPELQGETFRGAAIGRFFATAIRSDGTAVTWGPQFTQVPPELQHVRFDAVACGRSFTVAAAPNGTLYGWGDDSTGQIDVPAGRFKAVATRNYSLGLRDDGKLFGWGAPDPGVPVFDEWRSEGGLLFSAPDRYRAVAAGNVHLAAVRLDGTIVAYGSDDFGGLDGPQSGGFKDVAVGFGFTVALQDNGVLVGWGQSPFGNPFATWTPIGNGLYQAPGRYQAIAAGAFHVAAITAPSSKED